MDKKDLRRKVLQLHYDISGGSTLSPVLRPEVGTKLGIDFNDNELMAAIKYLNDKGFLKPETNVQDSITAFGIDEVENNFPTLGSPPTPNNEDHSELLNMLEEIDEKIDLAKKSLLQYTELQETQRKAEDVLQRYIHEGTDLWRDFDKHKNHTTYWEKYPKSKYTSETSRLPLWRDFIVKALNAKGLEEEKKQQLIPKGGFYTGRQIVRKILEKAKSRIDIQDNYASIELLNILQEYVEVNPSLKIRVLTQKSNSSFKSDLSMFIKEYPNTAEARTHESCHDRFIIIDGDEVFHSGHSFKDLGNKTSLISLVGDKEEKNKFIAEFDSWWNNGSPV